MSGYYLNPYDFNISSKYEAECPKCESSIFVEDHPLDLDTVTCSCCKTVIKILPEPINNPEGE